MTVDQVFGHDDDTGIFIDYAGDQLEVFVKLYGQRGWPTQTAVHEVIEAVIEDGSQPCRCGSGRRYDECHRPIWRTMGEPL
jgi:hypothetical protein